MANSIKKFEGKKLLLLGTNPGTVDMVNYARSEKAYVIVTDNQPSHKSAAKQAADEAWLISTADVDDLEKMTIQHKVSGIFAGVSEFNLEKVLTLCERLNLPFYCNRKQWETCSNKQLFKQLCMANDIPVPREYKIDSNYWEENLRQINYPVIVKPVDRSAGTGIHICRNEDELIKARSTAITMSRTKQAIVEEFIEGDEFMAGYIIHDGQFSLSYTEDRLLNPKLGETMPLPQLVILPSKYSDLYLRKFDDKIIKMFQNIGLFNGFIFVQGKFIKDCLYLFEANYRVEAGLWYRFTSRINGINYMAMLVNHALTGKMEGYDLRKNNPKFNKFCSALNMFSKGGILGKIIGLEDLRNKDLIAVDQNHGIGDCIQATGTLGQHLLRFLLIENSLQEVKNSVIEIQNTVKVLDDRDCDMLLPLFDTNRIET